MVTNRELPERVFAPSRGSATFETDIRLMTRTVRCGVMRR
jgi:hypothetical protein